MEQLYGMHGRIHAQPGMGDELEGILLTAADGLRGDPDCLLYVVSRDDADPDVVCVTEAWTTRAAHDASLQQESVKAQIAKAMPLLAGRPDATELRPVGGKGL
jgi:quinol monooxygenase YgiN